MDEQNHMGMGSTSPPIETKVSLEEIKNVANEFRDRFNFKKMLIIIMLIVIASLSFIAYKVNEIRTRAFIVSFGNEKIGIVRDKEQVLNILEDIRQELVRTYDIDIVLNKNISFEDTHAKDNMLVSNDKLRENIKSRMTFFSRWICVVNRQ